MKIEGYLHFASVFNKIFVFFSINVHGFFCTWSFNRVKTPAAKF